MVTLNICHTSQFEIEEISIQNPLVKKESKK